MSTRLGVSYKPSMDTETRGSGKTGGATAMDLAELVKVLMEECQKREQEVAKERKRCERKVE